MSQASSNGRTNITNPNRLVGLVALAILVGSAAVSADDQRASTPAFSLEPKYLDDAPAEPTAKPAADSAGTKHDGSERPTR
jgi:hypothetical protein